MTGIIDAHPLAGGMEPQPGPFAASPTLTDAVTEQAKGVLIFRYGIAAEAAYSLLELWAAQTGSTAAQVAHAVVHEICQGDRSDGTDLHLVRWLEERLRHEVSGIASNG